MDEIADLINDIPVSKTTSKQKLGLRGWRFAPRTVEEPRPSLVASITRTYREGRAIGVSMVGFSQRPAFITRFPYSQATHLVLWDTNDLRDAKILGDISGKGNPREIMRILSTLDYHEFLYVDTRSGRMFISKVEEV
jgi:hypothetical protein